MKQTERGLMKIRILSGIALVVFLVALLVGCSSGIPQAQYDQIKAQFEASQAKVAELQASQSQAGQVQAQLQTEIQELKKQQEETKAELAASQAQISGLQGEVGGLKEQYELAGATPAETAQKIVRYYHETHVYSTYDLFVCSDMASEVWNMLKAQGISAVVAVGNIDTVVNDIVLCDHAWVLAEVAPGEYLALETTGGFAVPGSENHLYYRGWSFATPGELKDYNRLIREYNVRVDIRNQIVAEDGEVVAEHNKATNQTTADELKAVHDKLVEIMAQQKSEMDNTLAEINKLAKVL